MLKSEKSNTSNRHYTIAITTRNQSTDLELLSSREHIIITVNIIIIKS